MKIWTDGNENGNGYAYVTETRKRQLSLVRVHRSHSFKRASI